MRNVARHRPRQFVHAIGERDIFVAHAELQPRAEYGHDHGLLLYQLCFSYLGRSALFVPTGGANRHQIGRFGTTGSRWRKRPTPSIYIGGTPPPTVVKKGGEPQLPQKAWTRGMPLSAVFFT